MATRIRFVTVATVTAMASVLSPVALACATCGCSLSSDAAMGYSATTGWRFNIQFDYLDQDQLRYGTSSISPAQVAAINDAGGNQEVENRTINRYTTASLAYSSSADWNFRFSLPYIDRTHTTYGAATNPVTPDQTSGASLTGIGDVKFITSYQGFLPTHNFGVQLGIKLPTGHYGGPNAAGTGAVGRSPVAFGTGPNSQTAFPGNLVDTSLQVGSGSTDAILGAYYFQPISQNFDAFINGQFQSAVKHNLDEAGQDYRPGNTGTISFGARYEANPGVTPQLQVNISRKSHDQGALADVSDTAGTVAYLSPGLTASVMKNTQLYGFVQLPVYSKLDGYQLFPRWTASVGISIAF